ncbi:MAG: lipase family protein [Alphaproteobacteria bacterium]|nr:lipase family protein [Alphaproteobacteria bacterium]MBV9692134.1 lipase family protein [Alphaproteobacteria bacterium]
MPTPPRDYRLINACIAAYGIAGGTLDPKTPGYDKIGLKAPPKCFVAGDQAIDACFVGETTDDWAVLAFRGTLPPGPGKDPLDWILDWLQDFQIGPVPWTVNGKQFGIVEGGFARAMLALWPSIKGELDKIDLNSKKGLWITGHSKGGSLTGLAASLVRAAYPKTALQIVAFAPALTYGQDFKTTYYAEGLGNATVRYQNECDIVPFLPLILSGAAFGAVLWAFGKTPHLDQIKLLEYDAVGTLNYINFDEASKRYNIEQDAVGQAASVEALGAAILGRRFDTIVSAHSGSGGYLKCFGIP